MTDDPFQRNHKANARAAEQKAAKDATERAAAEAKARLAAKQRPKFNDLPTYTPRDAFRWGLG